MFFYGCGLPSSSHWLSHWLSHAISLLLRAVPTLLFPLQTVVVSAFPSQVLSVKDHWCRRLSDMERTYLRWTSKPAIDSLQYGK